MDDESLKSKLLPEGAVFLEAVTAYTYIDHEGDECWGYFISENGAVMKIVGLLEQTKASLLSEAVAQLGDS